MQREQSRAAVQACVREQRALSVPKKQPRGDFHPIGPSATAGGRACEGLWREPIEGTPHGSKEKGPFVIKYYVLLSPTAPQHLSVLLRAKRQTQKDGGQRREECKMRSEMKQENKREGSTSYTKEYHRKMVRICTKIYLYFIFLSLLSDFMKQGSLVFVSSS